MLTPQNQPNAVILIVDDNELNRDLLGRRVQTAGYEVQFAENGTSTLSMLEQHRYDLILLDIMMPDLDGIQVLGKIRQNHSMVQLPIIMVTAKIESDDIVKALQQGANDYVTKPVNHHILLARIQTHLSLKRLAALSDDSLATASHDLKKPVNLVNDVATTLMESIDNGTASLAEIQDSLPLIIQSTHYMDSIISNFLDLQAIGSGHIKLAQSLIDINELAKQTVTFNQEYAKRKGISLHLILAPQLPKTRIDRARIAQVLENLVGNAIKFSPRGGHTVIRTFLVGDQARVEISDDGPGVSDADFPNLFQKFMSLSNRPTGGETSTGLGLAICKQVIELHHGTIGATNNPHQGVTFWFQIPVESIYANAATEQPSYSHES